MNPLNVNVGDNVSFTIAYFDTNGNPIAAPTTDSPPAWSDDNGSVGTLTQAADGNTAQESIVAAGTDDVTVSVTVGGQVFTATLTITAAAVGQTVGSIQIVPSVNGVPTRAAKVR